ncbi:MAG: hypothetical protein J4F41_00260 [Alphaproteobacteria bacterium]|nr:hypothetical protein [Alphaproteobacteria bacterium]
MILGLIIENQGSASNTFPEIHALSDPASDVVEVATAVHALFDFMNQHMTNSAFDEGVWDGDRFSITTTDLDDAPVGVAGYATSASNTPVSGDDGLVITHHADGALHQFALADNACRMFWRCAVHSNQSYGDWIEIPQPATQAQAEAGTAGDGVYMTPQRVAQAIAALAYRGETRWITASGNQTVTIPDGCTVIEIEASGGGGGGGGDGGTGAFNGTTGGTTTVTITGQTNISALGGNPGMAVGNNHHGQGQRGGSTGGTVIDRGGAPGGGGAVNSGVTKMDGGTADLVVKRFNRGSLASFTVFVGAGGAGAASTNAGAAGAKGFVKVTFL